MKTYIISAGGTGGHLYPAIELANSLVNDGHKVLFIASQSGIDRQIFASHPDIKFDVKYWRLKGLSREKTIKAQLGNVRNAFSLINLLIKSEKLIKNINPTAVIGFGGYISFPIVYMASKKNIATIIHEQNSYPGLVNRKLANKVDQVLVAYKTSEKYFDCQVDYVGNPRADKAFEYCDKSKIAARQKSILLIGGSLGAEVINNLAIEFTKQQQFSDYQITLICGDRYFKDYEPYESKNLKIIGYEQAIWERICEHNIIICRAGASTLHELMAMEKRIIAIPSPNVVANHQELNAREFCHNDNFEMILESDVTFEKITERIKFLENIEVSEATIKSSAIEQIKEYLYVR